MAEHIRLGTDGEKMATDYLVEHGYIIRETNWRFGKKEIDIIAQKQNTIAIVEVKTRSTDYFGMPEESVTPAKQKLLIAAADEYLQQLNFSADVRYDIIAIIKKGSEISIDHIKEAFIPLAK